MQGFSQSTSAVSSSKTKKWSIASRHSTNDQSILPKSVGGFSPYPRPALSIPRPTGRWTSGITVPPQSKLAPKKQPGVVAQPSQPTISDGFSRFRNPQPNIFRQNYAEVAAKRPGAYIGSGLAGAQVPQLFKRTGPSQAQVSPVKHSRLSNKLTPVKKVRFLSKPL